MANEQNLKPIQKGELTKEEAKRRGSLGGKKSAQVRRENKLIRDRILERMGEDDWDTMIDNLIARASEDTKSFETLRDTIGQKPTDKLELNDITGEQSKLNELLDQRRHRHEGK